MSSDIVLSSNVIVFLFIETILLLLQFIVLFYTIKILKSWDFSKTTTKQYLLEKYSYLATLIIFFTIIIKISLLPYFVYTIDILSVVVPGAMCAAGVISSNDYGEPLLVLKVIVVFLASLWIIVNKNDIKSKRFNFLIKKFWLYIILFVFLIVEYVLDILYFSSISTVSIATCCSAIYDSSSVNALPFSMNLQFLLVSFYSIYILILFFNYKQLRVFSGVLNIIFLYISYYAVIYFFGTYIYELPTHHCPFCMMQSDYFYIGYFIFLFLFLGTFFGIANFMSKIINIKQNNDYFKYSTIFNTLYVSICTLYVTVYYLKNGVFL
ncbi:MAG: hypothetical protein U9Q20_01570 [Campylobacterota bacterium]|nr:hypothetical protein [Campylobacterota bacterium]